MSSIFSELVAEILLKRAASASDSEKYLIGSVLGVAAAEIYAEVIAQATGTCVVRTGHAENDQLEMQCIALENKVVVIPYLVLQESNSVPSSDLNRGNRFFNGKLRDWFDRQVDSDAVRVLITFDENPIETEKTAMDVSLHASLTSATMLDFAAARIREIADRTVAPLITELLKFVRKRTNLGARDVAHTVHALRQIADSTSLEAAGNALVKLPWLLRDPDIEISGAGKRFDRAKALREELDKAVRSATEDFEQQARSNFSDPLAERLITSRSLGGVDWGQFTLKELEEGQRQPDRPIPPKVPNGFDPSRPAWIEGAELQIFKLVNEKESGSSRRYGVVSKAAPGKSSVQVRLQRELEDRETLHLFTYQPKGDGFVRSRAAFADALVAAGMTDINFEIEASGYNANWFYFEVVLTAGSSFVKNYLARADFALLVSTVDLDGLPYESQCRIDASEQCFVAEDQAVVELFESGGTTRTVDLEDVKSAGNEGDEAGLLIVRVGEQNVELPVRYEVTEEGEPSTDGEHSAEHAMLRFAAMERVPLGKIAKPGLVFGPSGMTVKVGGRERRLNGIPSLRISRWAVEAAILRLPLNTAYSINPDGELCVDERLDSLSMDSSTKSAFAEFIKARVAFFGALLESQPDSRHETILASDLVNMVEAESYVGAYRDLLAAVPEGSNWQSEYERILLVDSVIVDGEDALFIAPTSPLAVALHRELQGQIDGWAEDDPANLLEADADALLPTYLLPMVKSGDDWFESELTAYPWRLYRPREETAHTYNEPFLPRFISRRITEFLEVHPTYCDHNRVLTLAFVNPGDANHVLAALQKTINDAAKQGGESALDCLPQFEVKLYASKGNSPGTVLGSALDTFMSNMQESPPTWTELELMRRLSYTKGPVEEFVYDTASSGDASSFAHVAFIQNYFRPGERQAYDLYERTSTAYAGGMAVDLERSAEINANDVTFSSGVWFDDREPKNVLLNVAERSLAIAASASGNVVQWGRALGIVTRAKRQLIPLIYDRAVWVVHLDKHIGLELFAPNDEGGGVAPYILDHTDQENLQASGFDAITATTMVKPYLRRIEAIFGRHVDGVGSAEAVRMLRWLNLLSGRWALRLLKEPDTAVKERLGAVVAYRMLMLREHIYSDVSESVTVVISLDEILRVTPKEGLKTGEGLAAAFQFKGSASDDLLLLRISLNWDKRPTVYARVIEVKYSEGTAPVGNAWKQVNATQDLLQRVFGRNGPGRPFRGRMLSKLVRSYVSRLQAFGLLDRELDQTSSFIRTMDHIGAGDYEFKTTFYRNETPLLGDFVSVEPNYEVPIYQGDPYNSAEGSGPAMGRIRLGGSMIRALIADSPEAQSLGVYLLPGYGDRSAGAFAEPDAAAPREGYPARNSEEVSAQVIPGRSEAAAGDETLNADRRALQSPPKPEQSVSGFPDNQSEGELTPVSTSGGASLRLTDRFLLPPEDVRRLADQLDQTFARYQLPVQPFQPSSAQAGPNVIRFRTRMLDSGTIGKIEARARDIQREIGVEEPIYVGQEPPFIVVDIPRSDRKVITFNDVLPVLLEGSTGLDFGTLPIVMGVDAAGRIQISDLATLPHLMVAGTTGSGKSVFLSTIGACLGLVSPARLELVVIDIKGIDLTAYSGLPHTRGGSPIDDPGLAIALLESLIKEEVSKRKAIFRQSGSRHITEHYSRTAESEWPKQIVVLIDEYAQLVSAAGSQKAVLEGLIQQYAQFARAFGIYLVLATQRPSVDVITGRIKANLPARCVFKLPSFNDSRTVIDTGGAEKLLGAGDMLFYRDGLIQRLQAVYTNYDDFLAVGSRYR